MSDLHALHPNAWIAHDIKESDPNLDHAASWIEHVNDRGQRECVTATPSVAEANAMVAEHEKWRTRDDN